MYVERCPATAPTTLTTSAPTDTPIDGVTAYHDPTTSTTMTMMSVTSNNVVQAPSTVAFPIVAVVAPVAVIVTLIAVRF
jgi:hypothetical protein